MGTWGTAVDADDTLQDVIGLFDHHLKRDQSIEAALSAYREELDDFDDGPSVLFALIERHSELKNCESPSHTYRKSLRVLGALCGSKLSLALFYLRHSRDPQFISSSSFSSSAPPRRCAR